MSTVARTQSLLVQLVSPDSRIRWIVLGTLYLVGFLYWLHSFGVFSTGADGSPLKPELGYLDWPRNLMILDVIKDAFLRFELPYVSSMALFESNQFLALSEVPITPQQLLLLFVSTDAYILLNTLFMYSLGFMGLLLFTRRYRLSAVTSALLFGLFMFNGHVISHLAIGHIMWVAYFLLPYLMYLLFRMADRSISPRLLALLVGGVLFAILQQGALHIFVFAAVFTVAAGLARRSYAKSIVAGIGISLILDMFRLLPTVLYFDLPGLPNFDGFESLSAMWNSLAISHDFTFSGLGVLRWWEYDSYVGIVGLATILSVCSYAVYRTYLRYSKPDEARNTDGYVLLLPALLLLILSYGGVTGWFYELELPLDLNRMERVPSRFILMALVPAIFVTVVVAQRLLEQQRRWVTQIRIGSVVGLIIAGIELGRHALLWRIVDIESQVFHPSERAAANVVDVARNGYHTSVDIGLFVTVLALAIWVLFLIRTVGWPIRIKV
jgi:hypothetical protein